MSYRLSKKPDPAVSVDFVTNAVKESVKHLDGLITVRSAKNLVAQIDKLIGEHLNHIFVVDQVGEAIGNAPAKNEKVLQNLVAFRAHVRSKKIASVPAILPPVNVTAASGEQASNVIAILSSLKGSAK